MGDEIAGHRPNAIPGRSAIPLAAPFCGQASNQSEHDSPSCSSGFEWQAEGTIGWIAGRAGQLYNAEGPVQLDVVAHLAGFQGAVSYHASHAMEGLRVDHLPHATHGDQNLITVDSEELKSSPEHVARELIERWLVSFYEGDDLLAYVTVPREIGTRLR